MNARVCVVTAGHLSTCPRMLKTADALHDAGYHVRVISTRHVGWAWAADQRVKTRREWTWQVVDYDRASARGKQLTSGVRFRGAQAAALATGAARVPLAVGIRGYSRVHDELVSAIACEPADFVYGGTTGALAAVAAGAQRLGVRFGLDLEDFHSAEQTGEGSELAHALAERIESDVLATGGVPYRRQHHDCRRVFDKVPRSADANSQHVLGQLRDRVEPRSSGCACTGSVRPWVPGGE